MPSFDLTQNMSSSYMLLALLEKGELEWIGKSQNTVHIYFRSNQLKQLKYKKKMFWEMHFKDKTQKYIP